MFSEEHLYSIALRQCNYVGDVTYHKLIQQLGTAENVWKEIHKTSASLQGIPKNARLEIGNKEHLQFAENELKFCEKNNIHIHLRQHYDLPYLINKCFDAPAILYRKGSIPERVTPISIVGTRNCTPYGKDFIRDFLAQCHPEKTLTISGLAHGIDTEVHHRSLERDIPTIGVLAHGLHMLYPSANRRLSQKIIEQKGALLTEYNSSHRPDREHFIQRNRIIAGLSKSVIIVETAFAGGSMSTANFAHNYNRKVYALPGKITDLQSQGCNHLIYNRKAISISTIKELLKKFDVHSTVHFMDELFPSSSLPKNLSKELEFIYQIIAKYPKINLDDLAEKSERPVHEILPIILELEIMQHIQTYSGKHFSVL